MRIGQTFTKGTVTYTVVTYYEHNGENVALLIRTTKYEPYVTIWNLREDSDDSCSWYFEHYYCDIEAAANDYIERKINL